MIFLEEEESFSQQIKKEKLLGEYLRNHEFLEIQDLYKWIYYGEFGPEERLQSLDKRGESLELQNILDELEAECTLETLPERIWDPVGFSGRFVIVYLTLYEKSEAPLKRIINLIQRSPAFVGSRMQFKLDWAFLKEYTIKNDERFTRQDFTNFEDSIDFYQLPEVEYSETYAKNRNYNYRVVPAHLFFEYFPEFLDEQIFVSYYEKRHLFD